MGDIRKKQLVQMANRYSDIAINESTQQAGRVFFKDYLNGEMNCSEHVILMCLVQQYINCKCGVISREDCKREQTKLLNELEND